MKHVTNTLPTSHDLTGRDALVISEALRIFVEVCLQCHNAQAQHDAEDAIAILFAYCGSDLDFFALHYPELVGQSDPH